MSDGRAALLWSGKFPNIAQTRTNSQCYCVTNLRERFLYKSQKKFPIWCPTSLSNEVLRPNLNFGAKNRHSSSDNVLFIQILSLACWS